MVEVYIKAVSLTHIRIPESNAQASFLPPLRECQYSSVIRIERRIYGIVRGSERQMQVARRVQPLLHLDLDV